MPGQDGVDCRADIPRDQRRLVGEERADTLPELVAESLAVFVVRDRNEGLGGGPVAEAYVIARFGVAFGGVVCRRTAGARSS